MCNDYQRNYFAKTVTGISDISRFDLRLVMDLWICWALESMASGLAMHWFLRFSVADGIKPSDYLQLICGIGSLFGCGRCGVTEAQILC